LGLIRRVYLRPDDAPAYPEAVRAILEADLIVAGPGSLFTSIYTVLDHVEALESHVGPGLFPWVLANSDQTGPLPSQLQWVRVDPPVNGSRRLLTVPVADARYPWRHDPAKLSGALTQLLAEQMPGAKS
jgi:hypothetical protein